MWITLIPGARWILGHNSRRSARSVIKACENGLSFGCATGIEVEIAEFICEHIPHVDMIRMVNSGTEAVMSAIRAARGFTGKDKIIKLQVAITDTVTAFW